MTPLAAASLALQKIKLCSKRIADVGLLKTRDDLGFEAHKLQENEALVEAVALVLGNKFSSDFTDWDRIEADMKSTLKDEARIALGVVDSFERKPTT